MSSGDDRSERETLLLKVRDDAARARTPNAFRRPSRALD